MPDKNETVQVYRCIIRIEMRTDSLSVLGSLTDEINKVLMQYGAKIVEVVSLPETTTPAGRA